MDKPADPVKNSESVPPVQSSGTADTARRRAGALVRINLAPLMARRDAVLDAAEVLLEAVRNDQAPVLTAYHYLSELFASADRNTRRVSGMFNNPDTVAREQRLAMHIGILAKLAASLDEFFALKSRMQEAAAFYADDPGNEFKQDCTDQINIRLSVVESNLFEQLCDYFDRIRARIARYRQYAVKNFSKDNLECYQKSYCSVIKRCDLAFEQFSVKISTPQHEVFFQ